MSDTTDMFLESVQTSQEGVFDRGGVQTGLVGQALGRCCAGLLGDKLDIDRGTEEILLMLLMHGVLAAANHGTLAFEE
jgi:hypothetical protein